MMSCVYTQSLAINVIIRQPRPQSGDVFKVEIARIGKHFWHPLLIIKSASMTERDKTTIRLYQTKVQGIES